MRLALHPARPARARDQRLQLAAAPGPADLPPSLWTAGRGGRLRAFPRGRPLPRRAARRRRLEPLGLRLRAAGTSATCAGTTATTSRARRRSPSRPTDLALIGRIERTDDFIEALLAEAGIPPERAAGLYRAPARGAGPAREGARRLQRGRRRAAARAARRRVRDPRRADRPRADAPPPARRPGGLSPGRPGRTRPRPPALAVAFQTEVPSSARRRRGRRRDPRHARTASRRPRARSPFHEQCGMPILRYKKSSARDRTDALLKGSFS